MPDTTSSQEEQSPVLVDRRMEGHIPDHLRSQPPDSTFENPNSFVATDREERVIENAVNRIMRRIELMTANQHPRYAQQFDPAPETEKPPHSSNSDRQQDHQTYARETVNHGTTTTTTPIERPRRTQILRTEKSRASVRMESSIPRNTRPRYGYVNTNCGSVLNSPTSAPRHVCPELSSLLEHRWERRKPNPGLFSSSKQPQKLMPRPYTKTSVKRLCLFATSCCRVP